MKTISLCGGFHIRRRTSSVTESTNTAASSYTAVENAVAVMENDYTFRRIVCTIGMGYYTFMGTVYTIGECGVLLDVTRKLDKQ